MVRMEKAILYLGVAQIIADPNQPRTKFDPEKLKQMAASLKARGMLQPIRVYHDKERNAYRIVVGESRWHAAKLAGIEQIPCIVMEGDTPDAASLLADRLIENVCRSDLTPLELARGISMLKRLRKCTSQDAAAELGLSGASICRAEALLSLPEEIQRMVEEERLSPSIAYEIGRLGDEELMRDVAETATGCRLNRDQVIELCRHKGVEKKKTTPRGNRLSGKTEGVAFSFSFSAGKLTPDALMKALDAIMAQLKKVQRSNSQDISALAELLRAS
jgi:ParB family chromosome partitioning protein